MPPTFFDDEPSDESAELASLRSSFPEFRIWREQTYHGTRYVARSLHLSPGLHTLVTSDAAELRSELAAAGSAAEPPVPA
jgi:hypothetical protein